MLRSARKRPGAWTSTMFLLLLVHACTEASDVSGPGGRVASIDVSPGALILFGEDSAVLGVTLRSTTGRPLLGRTVTWSTGDSTVAVVDALGVVRARSAGSATITAASGGVSGSTTVRVLTVLGADADLLFADRAGRLYVGPVGGPYAAVALPEGMFAQEPAGSPDGRRIAFTARTAPSQNTDIWVVDRDGTGLRRLTTHPDGDDMPTWSPDGLKIAFRSERTGFGDLFLMNADGTQPVQLTSDPHPGAIMEKWPAFSPDGRRLAYTSTAEGTTNVWILELASGTARRLTSGAAHEGRPAWSPDGSALAFYRSGVEGAGLVISPLAGGPLAPLPTPEGVGFVSSAAWSPDGVSVAFVFRPVDGPSSIYTVDAHGAGEPRLRATAVGGGVVDPSWIVR